MNTPRRLWQYLPTAVLGVCGLLLLTLLVLGSEYILSSRESQLASVSAAKVVSLTNAERSSENLPPLRSSELLTRAAQLKAEHMAEHEYYAHVSPDGRTPLYWLEKVGYRYLNAGENLVIDRTTSEQVVSAWMNSSDHRKNILRAQFTEIGVGIAHGRYKGEDTIFVAQVFATPYPSAPVVRETPKTPVPTTFVPAPPKTTPTTPLRTPDPIPAPTITPKPPVSTPNTLITQVETLAAPILESLQLASSSIATSTPQQPQFGRIELPEAIELPAPAIGSPIKPGVRESMRNYIKTLGLRIADLWGWTSS